MNEQVEPEFSRAVSLLFTDIEGSSQHWDRDPIAMRGALKTHDEIIRAVVAERSGTVFYTGGDGFGVALPTAHAAVSAAREAQVRLAAADWPASARVRVRMGVHTGVVDERDGNYFGAAVNKAARIADAGHGGQVLVSAVTAALVGPAFEFVELGSYELEGLGRPERILSLTMPEARRRDFPPLRTARSAQVKQLPVPTRLRFDGTSGFVGRSRPLRQLLDAWKIAREGGSPVVLVSGEPGVGKTRLVAEAISRVHMDGATVLYGRCDHHSSSPFQPFEEALTTLAERLGPDEAQALFAPRGRDLARVVPKLAQILPHLEEQADGDGGGNRHRLFAAVDEVLAALAERSPLVVLVIDDVHWADPSTIALLDHLVVTAAPPGVAIAITYRHTDVVRDDPIDEVVANARRRGGAVTVHLSGLTAAEVQDFVTAAADRELGDVDDIVAALHEITEGNPFFISELIRHFVEADGVGFDGGRWSSSSLSKADVPRGIRELVRQRLAALPPETVGLVEMAATFGAEVDVRFLAAACGADLATTLTHLEPAVAAGLVTATGSGRYAFEHTLVPITIYNDLPAGRRVAAHVAAARAIEAVDGSDQHWSDLAHHWGEAAIGGHVEEAVTSALAAAERALAGTAHDEALTYLRNALRHFDGRPSLGGVERIAVEIALAEALNMAGRLEEAEAQFLVAADEARRAKRADLFARAALGLGGELPLTPPVHTTAISLLEQALAMHPEPGATRALLLGRLAERRHRIDDRARRVAICDEAVSLARSLDDDDLLARVVLSRARALHGPAALEEMVAISREVDVIAARLGDDEIAERSAHVRVAACFGLGDLAGAAQAARVASVLAERLRQPEYLRLPLMWDACRAMYEGRFDAGVEIIDRLGDLLRDDRHTQTRAMAGALLMPRLLFLGQADVAYEVASELDIPYREAFLAWFSAEQGLVDQARRHLDRLGPVARIDADQNWSWWQAMVATATAGSLCGSTSILLDVRDAIAPWAHQQATAGLVTYLGSGHHHLGVVEGALGHVEVAVHEFEAALADHVRIGARPFVALTRVELAKVLDARAGPGDAEAAADLRADALTVADELGLENVRLRA